MFPEQAKGGKGWRRSRDLSSRFEVELRLTRLGLPRTICNTIGLNNPLHVKCSQKAKGGKPEESGPQLQVRGSTETDSAWIAEDRGHKALPGDTTCVYT